MNYSINESKLNKANKLFDQLEKKQNAGKGTFVEYTKKVDNKTYGIVKESTLYTIKVCDKGSGTIVAEDFNYIDGFGNRKRFQRGTLQEAIKYLHLYLNEDKYVLDIPVVTPEVPQSDNVEGLDGEMEMGDEKAPAPEMDADMEGDSDIENIDMGDEDAEGEAEGQEDESGEGEDDIKDMQRMTGKLSQDIRTQITDGKGKMTVGMFKSILAAGKDLDDKSKKEVMKKAEDVFDISDEEEEKDSLNEAPLSAYNLEIFEKNGLYGLKDLSGLIMVRPMYRHIDDEVRYGGNVNIVNKNGKKDYININKYIYNDSLSDDDDDDEMFLRESMNSSLEDHGLEIFEKNGLMGLLDEEGNVVLSAKYSFIDDVITPNGLLLVKTSDGTKIKIDIFSYMD